jgi:ribonuclease P protein component
MTFLAQPNDASRDRLGIIASRRLGGAVLRNRAKRRIRELFRQRQATPADSGTFDVVIIPRREFIDAPFAVLRTELENALRRIRTRR